MAPLLFSASITFILCIQLSAASFCGNLVINCNNGASNCYSGPCASFAPHLIGHNHLPILLHTLSPTSAPTATPTKFPTPRFIPYNRILTYNRLPMGLSNTQTPQTSTYRPNAVTTIATNTTYTKPTEADTINPSFQPTSIPTANPTLKPILSSIALPITTIHPSQDPSISPTTKSTSIPATTFISNPTPNPTAKATSNPTRNPSPKSTPNPSAKPTMNPTAKPTMKPTPKPTLKPTAKPIANLAQDADSDSDSDSGDNEEGFTFNLQQKQPVAAIVNQQISCPLPGERCSSAVTKDERCCGGEQAGSTRCKYTERDSNGYNIGTCCVKSGRMGCEYDNDCCRSNAVCVDFVCESDSSQTNGVLYFNKHFDGFDFVKSDPSESEKATLWHPMNILFLVLLVLVLPVFYCVYYRYYLAEQLEKIECEEETQANLERSYLCAEDAGYSDDLETDTDHI